MFAYYTRISIAISEPLKQYNKIICSLYSIAMHCSSKWLMMNVPVLANERKSKVYGLTKMTKIVQSECERNTTVNT